MGQARDRGEEYFLYPHEGGFGAFTAGIRRTLEDQGTEVLFRLCCGSFLGSLERRHSTTVLLLQPQS